MSWKANKRKPTPGWAGLEEHQEKTRSGANALLDWAKECGNTFRFQLPMVK